MLEKFMTDQRGVALMMVLWVMVLLAILATEFSSSMRVEVDSTRNFKEEVECTALAESGMELALAEVMEKADFHSLNDEGQLVFGHSKKREDVPADETGEEEAPPAPDRLRIPLGAGTVSYRIIDENRKININSASKKMLLRIFEQEGLQDEEQRAMLADSILDWRDANDLHRLNGAENDYYEHLDEPYPCKNAPLDTLEEMLWIKGMTPEILYGTDFVLEHNLQVAGDLQGQEKKLLGIYSLLTVQKTGIVNPNTAAPEVLNIFYPPDRVENILTKRQEQGRFDMSKSNYFTIYSLGEIKESGIRRLISARVRSSFQGGKPRIRIISWNDNEDPENLHDLFDESPQH